MTLEQKLDILSGFGFCLADPFKPEDLLESWPRKAFEKPGFNLVLVGLGMTEERPPWRPHSSNVRHLDTECIANHGDYVRIAEKMQALAQGSMPIQNVRDYVNVRESTAWLSFEFEGKTVTIDCKVQDDWVDVGIFAHFVELLRASDPSKIFLYYDLGGQSCIVACSTREQYEQAKRAGISFEPLA